MLKRHRDGAVRRVVLEHIGRLLKQLLIGNIITRPTNINKQKTEGGDPHLIVDQRADAHFRRRQRPNALETSRRRECAQALGATAAAAQRHDAKLQRTAERLARWPKADQRCARHNELVPERPFPTAAAIGVGVGGDAAIIVGIIVGDGSELHQIEFGALDGAPLKIDGDDGGTVVVGAACGGAWTILSAQLRRRRQSRRRWRLLDVAQIFTAVPATRILTLNLVLEAQMLCTLCPRLLSLYKIAMKHARQPLPIPSNCILYKRYSFTFRGRNC